jgi:hypothetical protein
MSRNAVEIGISGRTAGWRLSTRAKALGLSVWAGAVIMQALLSCNAQGAIANLLAIVGAIIGAWVLLRRQLLAAYPTSGTGVTRNGVTTPLLLQVSVNHFAESR